METKHEREHRRHVRMMRFAGGILTLSVALTFMMSCSGLVLLVPEPEPLLSGKDVEAGDSAKSGLVLGESVHEFASSRKEHEDRDMSGEELSRWFQEVERDMTPTTEAGASGGPIGQ